MARVRIPLIILGPDGRPLAGATAAVRDRVTGNAVTVYAAETGGAILAPGTIVSDAGGRIPGWTTRGALEATITGPAGAGLAPYVVAWEALPASDASAEALWLPDDLIAARMIAADSVSYAALAADVLAALLPIGAVIYGPWTVLPAGGRFLWADGGLIDRTAYLAFFTEAQHQYNGGIDPGSNLVRKPDRRGRVTVGADNFGAGAANRLTTAAGHPNQRGQSGGEERHTLSASESGVNGSGVATAVADHHHAIQMTNGFGAPSGEFHVAVQDGVLVANFQDTADAGAHGHSLTARAADAPHNIVQPYEADAAIVRVL